MDCASLCNSACQAGCQAGCDMDCPEWYMYFHVKSAASQAMSQGIAAQQMTLGAAYAGS
jgi:hypothetical protein